MRCCLSTPSRPPLSLNCTPSQSNSLPPKRLLFNVRVFGVNFLESVSFFSKLRTLRRKGDIWPTPEPKWRHVLKLNSLMCSWWVTHRGDTSKRSLFEIREQHKTSRKIRQKASISSLSFDKQSSQKSQPGPTLEGRWRGAGVQYCEKTFSNWS